MPFCRNCGNEVSSDAYVCIKCGSLINPVTKETIKSSESVLEFHRTATFWLLFAAVIFFLISVMFFNISLTSIYGRVQYSSFWNWDYVYVYPISDFSLVAFIASCISFILSIISYVTSFKCVKDEIISKTTNYVLLLIAISSLLYTIGKLFIIIG
jgi:hypothetical protein